MSNESPRLVAAVTVVLPGKKRIVVRPTQTVPVDLVSDEWIERALNDGIIYMEQAVPKLRDLKVARPSETVNVSSVQKGDNEENPLDDGIELVAGTGDPALDAQLQEIAAKQQAEGVKNDGAALPDKTVEVNVGTGEVTETGGEADMDDEEIADAQVS